jgi:hypothetical protein
MKLPLILFGLIAALFAAGGVLSIFDRGTDFIYAPKPPANEAVIFDNPKGIAEVAADTKALQLVFDYILFGGSELKAKKDLFTADGRIFDVPNGTRADLLRTLDSGRLFGNLVAVRLASGPRAGSRVMTLESNVRKATH